MRPDIGRHATELRRLLSRHPAPTTLFGPALARIPPNQRDAWLDGVWDVDDLPEDGAHLPGGCVPYIPCPVATVLEAVERAAVTTDDVFVDLGAGLGRASVLTHLATGAGCIGLEIQPDLVRAAQGRAEWLGLSRVRFVEGDAADLAGFIVTGTVFFMYCPFGGDRLERALVGLESIARTHPIRVCCVGMPPLDRWWLETVSTSTDLTVYRSTLPLWGARGAA